MNRPAFILACLLALLTVSCSSVSEKQDTLKRPVHHTDSGFKNLYIKDAKKSFFDFLMVRFFGEVKWAEHARFSKEIPWQELDLKRVNNPADKPQVSWLGHSTFLIQYKEVNILTDPAFCERTSPFSFAGPKRYTKHVVDYSKLPPIDYVIISHNHYDHLDSEATRVLHNQKKAPHYYVPLGIKKWLLEDDQRIRAANITEMDWGDSHQHKSLKVNAYPSQHWSARSLFDRFETLWASWRVELNDFSFWFAGDTGYNERLFQELGNMMAPVDLSLIPIGAYSPRDFMKAYHLNPEEAVLVHKHIRTRQSIGMHWGTYPLTAEKPTEPPIRLKVARAKAGLKENEFSVMKLGETRIIDY
jgi:N-acyl-phosphatidylethanolamine-hydrolysing phospholipase D